MVISLHLVQFSLVLGQCLIVKIYVSKFRIGQFFQDFVISWLFRIKQIHNCENASLFGRLEIFGGQKVSKLLGHSILDQMVPYL
jgi:hypothetical protein